MIIGAHVSAAGGLSQTLKRASDLGAQALQSFASSPRSLKASMIDDEEARKYQDLKAVLGTKPHFFHGVYLVNLASESKSYVAASIESLTLYQQIAGKIGGEGTIFHIGSHKGAGFAAVKNQIVEALTQVLEQTPSGVRLFLENAAGHKGVVGDSFAQLGELIAGLPSQVLPKIGVCVDTQHAFAVGYDLRNLEGVEKLGADFNKHIGVKYLGVIHANDSKTELGSRHDRHENIGKGLIGAYGFKLMLKHKFFADMPWILEVPGINKSGPTKEEVETLRNLSL